VGAAVAADANFWDTHGSGTAALWTIDNADFLAFIAAEIDAGKPFGATVDSGGLVGTDHWMVGVGYDLAANQWLGYNTWDNSLHAYDIRSAFVAGSDRDNVGIGFIRTFDFLGPVDDGNNHGNGVPEGGSAALLLGCALLALAGLKRRLQ
jgi:hypothetical protein